MADDLVERLENAYAEHPNCREDLPGLLCDAAAEIERRAKMCAALSRALTEAEQTEERLRGIIREDAAFAALVVKAVRIDKPAIPDDADLPDLTDDERAILKRRGRDIVRGGVANGVTGNALPDREFTPDELKRLAEQGPGFADDPVPEDEGL